MNIERVELLVTLKGAEVWKKGTIFDPKKDGHPIPSDIIAEARANMRKGFGKKTVQVLGASVEELSKAKPTVSVEAEISEAEARLAELNAKIAEAEAKLLMVDETKQEVALTGADILRMNHEQILDLLKDEEDFESLKDEKRTVLVGIANKRFVKNDQS